MKIIVCVDDHWGIGNHNDLLFHIPQDLQFFKAKTIHKTIVMGKNTLLSLPSSKPLPNRKNIVLSSTLESREYTVCKTLTDLFCKLKHYPTDAIFIIGGEIVYRELLPYCDTAYVTKVNAVAQATHFFPNLDASPQWHLVCESPFDTHNDLSFQFCKYANNNVKKYI